MLGNGLLGWGMDVTLNNRGEAFDEQGTMPEAGSETVKQSLSSIVWEGYTIDKASLSNEFKCWDECKKLVGMMPAAKGGRFEGSANINLPVVLNAAITFNARSYPAFFGSNNIVKCQVIGDDSGLFEVTPEVLMGGGEPKVILEPGAKQKRATRISQHMSWQTLNVMPNWTEDNDRLLMLAPIYGCLFKKTYYNTYTKTNCSELILPEFLTVHAETRDLESAPRITHSYGLYPYEIQERVKSGYFDEFTYTNEDFGDQHEFLDQYIRYDRDGDGYDEPLIVTMHTDTKTIVRVELAYIEADVTRNDGGEIIRIKGEKFFTKFGFMPNPTGGFYDIGFGYLLYQLSKALNTTVNQLLDAGTLANSPFFLLERGRMKGGEVKVRPGFGLFVNNDSRALKDSIYQMQFGGPDSVLFQLLGFLFNYARSLGGMREVLEGGMRSDQTTGSTEMLIEAGMNEYKAIYKRLWRSMSKEFKRLFELNHRYMDEKEYFRVLDSQSMMGRVEILREDYNSDDFDVEPTADADYLTSAQKKQKAAIVGKLAVENLVNPKVATRMVLEAENLDNIDELLEHEPTNAEVELKKQENELQMAAVEVQGKEATANILKEQNNTAKIIIEAARAESEINRDHAEVMKILAEIQEKDTNMDLTVLDRITKALENDNAQRQQMIKSITMPQQVPTEVSVPI